MVLEHETRVRVRLGEAEYFVESTAPLSLSPESALAAAFFPALAKGYSIVSAGAADKIFLDNMSKLAAIASRWWGWQQRNPFSVTISQASRPMASGAALFFTGGVDSFCSLLRHPAEIQHLIYVHGLDIPLSDTDRYAKTKQWIDDVAQTQQIQPIYITTNLRENAIFNSIQWGITHVSALASIAHLLATHIRRIFVAGSDVPPPWGSNEQIDPLWSSSNVQIISDGWQLSRLDKVRFISHSALVHKYLKVCWENKSSNLNCGYCEKCVRTQAQFAVSGTFECLETFPEGHLREKIDGVPHIDDWLLSQWVDIRNRATDPDLRRTVGRLLSRSRTHNLKGKVPRSMKRLLKNFLPGSV